MAREKPPVNKRLARGLAWNTAEELRFLRHLGRWRLRDQQKTSRRALLECYCRAAECRCDWGDVDKDVILEYVRNELWSTTSRQRGQTRHRKRKT
jgi:hypothetical protein